jgi:hypothetical protein
VSSFGLLTTLSGSTALSGGLTSLLLFFFLLLGLVQEPFLLSLDGELKRSLFNFVKVISHNMSLKWRVIPR